MSQLYSLYNFSGTAAQSNSFVVAIQGGSQGNFLSGPAGPGMGKAQRRATPKPSATTSSGGCSEIMSRCGQCREIQTADGPRCNCSTSVNPCANGKQTSYGGFLLNNITYSLYASDPSDCSVAYQLSFTQTFVKLNDGITGKSICEIMVYILGWYFSCPKEYNWVATSGTVPSTVNELVLVGTSVFDNNWITNIHTGTDSSGCFKAPTVYNCAGTNQNATNYFNLAQDACQLCLKP